MGGPGNIQLVGHIFTFRQRMVIELSMNDVQRVGLENVKQIFLSNSLSICEKVVVRKGSANAVSVISYCHYCKNPHLPKSRVIAFSCGLVSLSNLR